MLFFEPLNRSHIPLMHQWFNAPHVQKFYSLREWQEFEVEAKLLPLIKEKVSLKGCIISLKGNPIGYIQHYPVKDYPWKDLLIPEEMMHRAAGLDLFIGESEYIGKGLSRIALAQFLEEKIWPAYDYCFADPDEKNEASCTLFLRTGFRTYGRLNTVDALSRKVTLRIMLLERPQAI